MTGKCDAPPRGAFGKNVGQRAPGGGAQGSCGRRQCRGGARGAVAAGAETGGGVAAGSLRVLVGVCVVWQEPVAPNCCGAAAAHCTQFTGLPGGSEQFATPPLAPLHTE
jgi:hypothetical protein